MHVLLVSTVFLSIVLSIDSFAVGITYGMRTLKISPFALGVIGVCSATLLGISVFLGSIVRSLLMKVFCPISVVTL